MKWRKIAVHISVSFTGMLHTFVFINPATWTKRERERKGITIMKEYEHCASPRRVILLRCFKLAAIHPFATTTTRLPEKGKFTKVPCTGELFLNYRLARDQRG